MSGGLVPRTAAVEVRFVHERDTSLPLPADAFRLSPRTRGTLSWKDPYTLAFSPAEPLKSGKRYRAIVDGTKIGGGPELDLFGFKFETRLPLFEMSFDPVRINGEGDAVISGVLAAETGAALSRIEGAVNSPELGRPEWSHEEGLHRFSFAPLKRGDAERTVAVNWSGRRLGSPERGFMSFRVPAAGRFELMDVAVSAPGVLEAVFSSTLKQDQDLRGFVSLDGKTNIRYALDGNIARIFGSEDVKPGAELFIQDLADSSGQILAEPVQYRVQAAWELPEARFTGNGVILPTSQGTTMMVETRNISGLLVEAFQIYGDNMIQFLQVNDLEGDRELHRVGEPVWTRAFDFSWNEGDKNRWVRRGLDLSGLSRKYPDGMFHIRMSFRPRHVHYECTASHGDFSNLPFPDDSFPVIGAENGERSYWDDYSANNRFRYDWYRYRKDPCHPSFYEAYDDHDVTVGKNVLVSDLGLLAKRTMDGGLLLAVSDIKTALPVPGAAVELLNFQGKVLARANTGGDGLARFERPGAAAFARAQNAGNRGYLRLNDAAALAISHFDVSGDMPVNGIHGLIYGERGVWRPGDPIYLTFLLSDGDDSLPPDHPVLFELEDPRGRIAEQRTYTASTDGFYPISVSTPADAPTGDWTARVRVGGKVFSRGVKVETVMPNRLKMELDFGGRSYLDASSTPVSLQAAWLHGAPAPGLKADVSVSFGDKETSFNSYTDYSFRDPSRTVSGERYMLYEGNLDDEGKTGFNMKLSPGSSVPGKLNARFLTRVFEPTGVFSSEQIAVEFSPYPRYVGIKLPRGDASRNMLLTDTDHNADIVVLDADGKPASGTVRLDCAVYKLSWRWWWEKGAEERAEFSEALSHSPVLRETVNVSGGKTAWKFRVNYPEWGRYLILVRDSSGGHSAASIVYIDWPGWAGRAQEGGQGSAAMLTLTPEKPQYLAGEKIAVTFPSNKEAAALVTLEKAGKILKSEWINCADTLTRYEFAAEPSMTPNVYVHVSLLQKHLQTRNDLPIRLYGIVPVAVEDPATRLRPEIQAPANWQPESPVSFSVREASGRPMTYTAVVVDEGLLGLTRYSLPNPRSYFYAKEASFLKSWDLYSEIMGAYAGQLETLLAIGGGDDAFDDSVKKTERFKPVVRYFGPYTLKAGETRTEEFILPPYVGALRIMVMAASSGPGMAAGTAGGTANAGSRRAYGTAERSVPVSADLMVYGTVPRLLSPGDEAVIPVTVYSYREERRQVTVNFVPEAGLKLVPGAEEPPNRRSVSFDRGGEITVEFRVRAADRPGPARINVSAESAGLKTANHRTELEIRSTAVPVTEALTELVAPRGTWPGAIRLPGRAGTNTAVLELSRLPPLNLEGRLEFLITYPHGCVEQTTSSVFPQLYLDRILTLEPARLAETRSNISAGIERLMGFRTSGGGFSYWPGETEPHDWGSSYAGHFLVEAKRAGFAVPAQVIEDWTEFQRAKAAVWSNRNGGSQMDQAYRLYTLALAGAADLGSMNRLRDLEGLAPAAAWRLAAAYWYGGQRDAARSLAGRLTLAIGEYRELSGTFGSALRDKAMILETLALLGDTAKARPLLEEIAGALSSDAWLSTQESAYALIAAAPFVQGIAGKEAIRVEYSLGTANSPEPAVFRSASARFPLTLPPGETIPFRVANLSEVPVYARISARGLPREGTETAVSRGLSLQVEYRDLQGKPVDPDAVKVGDDVEIRVNVRNTGLQAVPEIAVIHPLPASWEIINYRLAGGGNSTSYDYQDIRDDRVMTYFDLGRGGQKTIVFRVNRAYGGAYFRPAVHAYAMYDESIRALVPGKGGAG
ncbi:MAG: alpha-2-macroglobulin, partial [Treponema sp.]|nr:alpha-2-macroglobulin [Treponema sp.]